jgi:hypothetical protein
VGGRQAAVAARAATSFLDLRRSRLHTLVSLLGYRDPLYHAGTAASLRELGPLAVPALLAFVLRGPSRAARQRAAKLLVELGPGLRQEDFADLAREFEAALAERSPVGGAAGDCLAEGGRKEQAMTPQTHTCAEQRPEDRKARPGPPGSFWELADPDAGSRRAAVAALAASPCVATQRSYVFNLVWCLGAADAGIRQAAAASLRDVPLLAFPALTVALLCAGTKAERRRAAQLLVELGPRLREEDFPALAREFEATPVVARGPVTSAGPGAASATPAGAAPAPAPAGA